MVTTVYIVRHCEAEGNELGIFQGSTDLDISEKGRKQLIKLSERFRNIKLDAAYSSPLIRAYRTAEAAVAYNKIPIIKDDGLTELNGGIMEGKPWNKLDVLFPKEYGLWKENFSEFVAPEGESVSDVYARITETFTNIILKNKNKTIGIFSHGCAIRILMCYIKGISLENIDNVLWCDNTAINCVIVDENGNFTVSYENDYTHLKNDKETEVNRLWWGNQD